YFIPAGPLREKETRLASVDFRVCNGDGAQPGEVSMKLRGDRAVALNDRTQSKSLHDFIGQRVHAVAGIGNPSRFFAMLRAAGLDVAEHPFPDHHSFAAGDLNFGDDASILMTEKDAVKCRAFAVANAWTVPVAADLPESFFDAVHARLETIRKTR